MTRHIHTRTQVAVVGAGPAGLTLANVLLGAGIDVQVLERRSREAVETRARAGLVEHRVVEYLRARGLADGLLARGVRQEWCDFLCLGERRRLRYAAHAGGAAHTVYPQQFLVRDLVRAAERQGAPPRFDHPVTGVRTDPPGVECPGLTVDADYVVGCDGHQGITREALPTAVRGDRSHRYPFDWLTVLTEIDRPVPGVCYALHERGFAGMMPRTNDLARCYLQVPPGDLAERWPESRLRPELEKRLRAAPGADLPRMGRIGEVGVLRMRSTISRRLRHGPVFLAGDAGHLLAPAGAKGMNAAVADAADLAHALVRRYRDGDTAGLDGYGARRLTEIWHVQEFVDRLLRLLNLSAPDGQDPAFELRLKREHLRRATDTGPYGTDFARHYVGAHLPPLPPPPGTSP